MKTRCLTTGALVVGAVTFPTMLQAQETGHALNGANTAWMLVSCALVLLMTPGLALFYGGLVRSKNVLSTMMHSLFCMALVTVLWFLYGGGMVFGDTVGGFFGKPGKWAALNGVAFDEIDPNGVPVYINFAFQMMFAIITPALISGAFAERIKFTAFAIFTALWVTLVYFPLAHWVWFGGIFTDSDVSWLKKMGLPHALDFAGGTVVHISSGVSALVFALMLGKRKGFPSRVMQPNNLPMAALGAGLLWFGWFGFNGGSGLAADAVAGNALFVTHLCAASAALCWALIEWVHLKKPSLLGIITGMVAGLVCITPAANCVTPLAAFFMGLFVSPLCYLFVAIVKYKLKYDDSLDAFGVHGIGGMLGALLTGVLCSIGAEASGKQFAAQAVSVGVTIVYAGGVTAVLLFILKLTIGIRATEDEEVGGLDLAQHGEEGYTI